MIRWTEDRKIQKRISVLLNRLGLNFIDPKGLHFVRSTGAETRALARIWGLGKIWQQTLNLKPHYIIEAVSERYDRLSDKEKDKILIHELSHIPKNFSGSLLPHIRHGKRSFRKRVDSLIDKYLKYKA